MTPALAKLRTYPRNRSAARAYGRVYMAGRYTELAAAGLCTGCGGADAAKGRRKCLPCLHKNNNIKRNRK